MFAERDRGIGPLFFSAAIPGRKFKDSIDAGDEVSLLVEEEEVLVRVTAILSDGHYQGEVFGFEPSYAMEHGALKLHDTVQFRALNVFSCSGS